MFAKFFLVTLVVGCAAIAAEDDASAVTFNKDVLPILQKNCQTCHRPGQIAPMSFLTYKETRPWAKAMKAAVASRKMPPWFADPQVRPLLERPLPEAKRDRDHRQMGRHRCVGGDPKDAPPAVNWPDGWQIQPDVIVKGPVVDDSGAPEEQRDRMDVGHCADRLRRRIRG